MGILVQELRDGLKLQASYSLPPRDRNMKEQKMENKNDNSKNNKWKKTSVFLSLVLRHQPDAAGITLDEHGWADVEELIEGFQKTGRPLDLEMLKEIVRTDEKGRYRMSEDGTLIRANQGHSIPVDVELKETKPPKVLYHGTAERFLPSIMAQGLKSMSRLYVHLSGDYETAVKVGKRHGKPVVLSVDTERMTRDGAVFYQSENGVWLTGPVESKYLEVMGRE